MQAPKVDLAAEPWLVVVDPQVIFAAEGSEWCSPLFADAWPQMQQLAAAFGERVLVTRWLPTADRDTAWGEYFELWPFADKPATDPAYDLLPEAKSLSPYPTVDVPTFGKWGPELWQAFAAITGDSERIPPLVLCGVTTDCCVLSTAIPAGDSGMKLTIATDACAGSAPENQVAALHVLGLFPPHITLRTTAEIIADLS